MRLSGVPNTDGDDALRFCREVHPKLVGFLALHTADGGLAEELTQDVLVKVLERWPAVRAMDHPEAWAFRVALNLSASRFRRRAAEKRATARLTPSAGTDDAARHTDQLAVRAALGRLPPRQRAVLIARYFADLSVAETATVMRCQPGTVKALTHQAISRLRTQFRLPIEVEA